MLMASWALMNLSHSETRRTNPSDSFVATFGQNALLVQAAGDERQIGGPSKIAYIDTG